MSKKRSKRERDEMQAGYLAEYRKHLQLKSEKEHGTNEQS